MRISKYSLFIGFTALAAGCAHKETESVYWTEKGGIASVHHVTGKNDHVEKLVEKPLKASDAENLPKGTYYQVVDATVNIAPKAKPSPSPDPKKAAKKDADGSKLAEVTDQIRDLKRQVSSVAAENQRLQEQLAATGQQQAQSEAPQQDTANAEAPPRMSQ